MLEILAYTNKTIFFILIFRIGIQQSVLSSCTWDKHLFEPERKADFGGNTSVRVKMGPYYQQPPFTSHSSGQSYQGNTFGWSSPAPYGVPRPMAGSVDSGSSIRPWNKPPALGFQSSLVRPSTLIPGSTSSGYPAPSASLPQSSVPGSSQMTVSRYEPIGITHRSLSSDEVAAWFCSSCNSPMICRVRLVRL